MAVKKMTKRWLFNSFGVILLIILGFEIAGSVAIYRYYYFNVARQALVNRADITVGILGQYAQDKAVVDFSAQLRDYVVSFPAREPRMELMIIDGDGNISMTSSGFTPDDTSIPDYHRAIQQGIKTDEEVMVLSTGEKVMSFTVVSPVESEPSLSALRLVTSMERVDRQVASIVTAMMLLGVGVLALILFSSSYFIGTIVNPVGRIGETARRIAQGDLSARLEVKTDDEIGELCEIINYMTGELETADRLKNDFISSVSHELRTPLTAIQGWGETIRSDGWKDKEIIDKGMNVIISETRRLSDMVEELLDFSRMQSGRLKLVRAPVDAVAELSEAVLMYTQRAEREGILLDFEDDGVVVSVYGDQNRLRQVFINVIDNAIKYSNRGGTVTVTSSHTPQTLIITVKDNGIGIRPEDLPRIKEKFYKADFTRRGSGIGLAMADEILARHAGKLEIDSVYGEGTTVTIMLPVTKGGFAQVDDPGTDVEAEDADV